ncbi:uncharacterized protein LOC123219631 [Mangifera indica]|uniref:uncharacterized protein LOC123219631 n=1 Tax=Mangifera indica TaxID=29780 RepID=UPI001CFA24C3|nr:uncharacterized protein LOC123219631 [Mangifera indica]
MEIQAQEAAQNDTQMPYEASMTGYLATLNTLIQNDPFILHKISLTPFTETPLHISALLGHVEFTKAITTSYLLSVPKIRVDLNSLIKNGLPAFDGSCRNGTQVKAIYRRIHQRKTTKVQTTQSPQKLQSILTSFFKWRRLSKYKSDTMKRQEETDGGGHFGCHHEFPDCNKSTRWLLARRHHSFEAETCPKGVICRAGTSIHAYTDGYYYLTIISIISFSASLSIILRLISGVPLRNRVSVEIVLVKMWVTVLFIANAYVISIDLVMPYDEIFHSLNSPWRQVFSRIWALSLIAIIFIHVIRFYWWVLKKLFMGVIFVTKRCCFKKKKQLDQPVVSA